jgi:malonate decarboxylase beta subunit
MGLIARCADHVVMSDQARMSMSGPEVIESSHGVEEFDSRDRALVWRTTGGKHRFLMGDCDWLVEDDLDAFRGLAISLLGQSRVLTLQNLIDEQEMLTDRLTHVGDCDEATEIWRRLGVQAPDQVADMDVEQLRSSTASQVKGIS